MPVTYEIDVARKLILTHCRSPLSFDEVIAHFRALQEDPHCSGYLDVLLDVSEADALPEGAQIRAINVELSAIRNKAQFGICAIVATRDAMFGMMRMFEALARPYFLSIRVFRARSEAETWLVSQQMEGGGES